MRHFIILLLMTGVMMIESFNAHAEEPPVGWFFLYPQIGEGNDVLPETDPTTLAQATAHFPTERQP